MHGVKEARTSLNKMRRQNREKQQQLEEERMLLERLQMQQKIELLRQQRREEEDHQEMLRQKRQQSIEDQLRAQDDESQRRLLQHQQRQMELHLSVQAEQQNKLRQYVEASDMPVYSQDHYAPMASQYHPTQPYSLPPQPVSQYQYVPSASFAPEPQVSSYGQVMGQPEPQSFSAIPSMEPSQLYGYPSVKEFPPSVGSMQPQLVHEPANISANLQSLQLAPQPQLQSQVYGGHQPMQSVQSGQPVHSVQVMPPSMPFQPAPQMNLPQSVQQPHHPPNPASQQFSYQLPPSGGYIPTQGPPMHQQTIDASQSLQPSSLTYVPGQSPPMQRRPMEDQLQPGRSYMPGYSQLPDDVVCDHAPPMLPSGSQPLPSFSSLQTGHQGYAPPQPTKPEVQLISFDQ